MNPPISPNTKTPPAISNQSVFELSSDWIGWMMLAEAVVVMVDVVDTDVDVVLDVVVLMMTNAFLNVPSCITPPPLDELLGFATA